MGAKTYVAKPAEVLEARALLSPAQALCKRSGVTFREVEGQSRESHVVEARHGIWGLLAGDGCSASHIARLYGVDHTTVLHAIRKGAE